MKKRWTGLAAALVPTVMLSQVALAATGFTTRVSPAGQTNATEPSVAVDRADGTVWVAWQASGRHVARSDDGGRTFVQTPINSVFGNDVGDVDIRVGGPTPCAVAASGCTPGTRRVYLTSLERLPAPLQTHLAVGDDRGASWTENNLAAINPSLIDRPWLAVYPSTLSASFDQVYIVYHDFSASQINVAASNDGGQTFGPSVDVLGTNGIAFADSFCNTIPSGIEVDPGTGEVYVEWITADPVANIGQGCNITQIQNFHQVWVAHSPRANMATLTVWDAHLVFDGGSNTNTDEIFATLAVDSAGNVYAVFPDNLRSSLNFDIWFSHSSNKAQTWSRPVAVNSDGGTNYFPWVVAGSSGRVDFIYLHTPDLAPSDTKLSSWSTKFAQTTNGTDAVPKFAVTSASSGIMHVGGICTNGIFCSVNSGNRDLADSISIAIDRGGSAALVWTDQGTSLHGPTNITYGCVTSQQTAVVGANPGQSCKGPAS
jgi:hypothetical protein